MSAQSVTAFGEALLRYSVPPGERLFNARSFITHAAGAELNLSAALTRLDVDCRFVTSLPDNMLGDLARRRMRENAISDDWVETAQETRMGVYYYEPGVSPRAGRVLYDRGDSAFARFPWREYAWEDVLKDTGCFVSSGITPALSESCATGLGVALRTAKSLNCHTVFDLNYRSKLWSSSQARSVFIPMIQGIDLLFVSDGDARNVLGAKGDTPEEMLREIAVDHEIHTVTMVYNPGVASKNDAPIWQAVAFSNGQIARFDQTGPLVTVDRLGAGDAYAAGFLWSHLQGKGLQASVESGSAMMALKNTVDGDFALIEREELLEALSGDAHKGVKR